MAKNKSLFPDGASLQWNDDGSYFLIEVRYVDEIYGVTENAARLDALAKAGVSSTETVVVSPTVTLRIMSASVKLLADDKAAVSIQWGIGDSPILDGGWIAETYSETIRDVRGVDVNQVALKIKYHPPGMTDAAFAADYNARRLNRGTTASGYHNRGHVIARRQISATQIAATMGGVHPLTWPMKYVHRVNYAIGQSSPYPAVPEGVFICSSIRVYTRNRGLSYFVEAEFVSDENGFDPIIIFTHPDGLIPGDITIPVGMQKAWPEPAEREITTKPYGASRPQMVKGRATFANPPFNLNLAQFYGV